MRRGRLDVFSYLLKHAHARIIVFAKVTLGRLVLSTLCIQGNHLLVVDQQTTVWWLIPRQPPFGGCVRKRPPFGGWSTTKRWLVPALTFLRAHPRFRRHIDSSPLFLCCAYRVHSLFLLCVTLFLLLACFLLLLYCFYNYLSVSLPK
jgi:hypothetical protein